MPADRQFWNRIAERYARKPLADPEAYRVKLDETRLRLRPDMRVLEIGCGTGSTALALAAGVREIVATDCSEAMIRIARAKAEAQGVANVSFAVAEASEPRPEAAFDAVLAMNVLHLLDDPEAALRHVARLLRPGGVLVSSTACIAEMSPLLRLALPLMRMTGFAPRVSSFRGAALVGWIERAGFAIDFRWSPDGGRTLFLIARRIGASAGRDGRDMTPMAGAA